MTKQGTFQHQLLACPVCGYRVNASTYVGSEQDNDGSAPEDGDCSLCISCGSAAVFCDGVTALRRPTADERSEIFAKEEVQKSVSTILTLKDRHSGWPKGDKRG